MRDRLRSPAQALLVCLAFAVAEIGWTYATGFATAQEALWICGAWGVIALALAAIGEVLPPGLGSHSRPRLYLLGPVLLLSLRGQHEIGEITSLPLNSAVAGGILLLVFLATRREVSLGRLWLLAIFCGAASTSRLALRSIEGLTMVAVLGVHPERTNYATMFGVLMAAPALLAWVRRWNGQTFALMCLAPSVLMTGGFVSQVSVRAPASPLRVESAPKMPTVVIVVLDTLRRDGLSLLGGPAGQTPNLDRFASRSTLFTDAYSNGTYSLTGHGSLFSGLLPSQHGAHPPSHPIRRSVRLLAEELSDLGYSPYGFSANPVYLAPWTGFQRGFKQFYSDGRDRFGYYPTATPFFRLTRLRAPEQFWWPASSFLEAVLPVVSVQGTAMFLNLMEGHAPRPEFLHLDDLAGYQATVRKLDQDLAPFLETLSRLPNAIVVITSDHGEFLGEHGLSGHSTGHLYEAGIQIPLLVRFPGQVEGRTDGRRVSLQDVPALVRAALDGVTGSFAVPLPSEPRVIAETWSSLRSSALLPVDGSPTARAIFLGDHKIIEHHDGFKEVFDLKSDPGERVNLVVADPAFARGLLALVQGSVPRMSGGPARSPGAVDVPPDVLERMRSLGYLK